jgi:hypothetical protein
MVTGTVVTAAVADVVLADSAVLVLLDELPHAAAPTVIAPMAPMAASERMVRDVLIKRGPLR